MGRRRSPRQGRGASRGPRSPAGRPRTFTGEIVVHTWDLATATDQHPTWDDDVVTVAFDAVRLLAMGGAFRALDAVSTTTPGWGGADMPPYGEALQSDADAPLIVRLVEWNGCRP